MQLLCSGLILHADPGIRTQAVAAMKRVLRGMPRLRNALVLGLAGLAARIPDDHPEVNAAPSCIVVGNRVVRQCLPQACKHHATHMAA